LWSDCNIKEAVAAVKSNKGAPGIDGITTEEIKEVMQKQWPQIKQAILEGKYMSKPGKTGGDSETRWKWGSTIGNPNGHGSDHPAGLHQELVPVFDPTFSQYSFGFRPNRSSGKPCCKLRNTSKKDANG
jgi:RNA-directed DNA polymerase